MNCNAFVSTLPLARSPASSSSPSICSFDGMRKQQLQQPLKQPLKQLLQQPDANNAMDTTTTMRCRRDLKKEKRLRNMEFARAHRKRAVKSFGNRRSQQEALTNADNDFLSSIYGTIRFRGQNEEEEGGK